MRKIFKISLVLCILFFATPKAYSQVHPEWLEKVQIFQSGKGYIINSSPIMSKVTFTGQGWGVYFPNNWYKPTLESEINAWHIKGGKYIAYGATFRLYWDGTPPVPDSNRLKDINGNLVNDFLDNRQYTICSEKWQSFVISENRKAIDLGIDGLHFDDVQMPPLIMSKWNPQPASFDSVTMAHFRNYLRENYSTEQIFQKFDVNNIDTFNYANWIKTHGMEDTWNNEPFTGLAAEFFKFMILATKEYFHNIAQDAKNYAMSTYGKEITISCNPNFIAEGYSLIEDMDYFLSEHYPFEKNNPFAHTDIKGTKCIKNWPVFVLPQPKESGLPQKTQNMIRLIMADIYASGGQIAFGDKFSEGIAANYNIYPIEINFDIFSKYTNFILSHKDLYEDIIPVSSVALLNSHSSRLARYWPVEGDTHIDYGNAFHGAGLLLADSNIQFDAIFAPDNRFTTIPSFTLEDLQRYKVVVLPHTFELTDEQTQTLLDYVEGGGVIVAMGNIGTNNPDGTLANRPTLLSLQQGDGVKTYGAGKFVYNSTSLGEAYIWDWSIPHETVRQQFQSMILPYISPQVKTYGVSQVYRPGGATGFLYQDLYENYILHLVNYDYNEFSDEFAVKENVTLKILADTTKAWEAVYVSPDFLGRQVLPTTNDSGYVSMTIPKLEAYGIVILQENLTAPQIVSRTPETNITIIGGDSLELSVEAVAPDGNPLFYRWHINGVVDSLGTDSAYLFRTSRSSSGIDTITVEVSDGSHRISTHWLITIQRFVFPKILFDESHNERNTISPARAQLLNPVHPDWIYFGILKSKMDADYITERYETGTLSPSVLQDYDVLILSAPNDNLSSLEINNIVSFVSHGGGLIFLGDSGLNQNINSLLQVFGIEFEHHVISEPVSPGQDRGNTIVYDFINHASLGTHPQFNMNWGGSFSVSSPAIALGFTDNTIWRDMDWDGDNDTNEPKGPFTIVAAAEYENGRIFCVSDNAFHNDYVEWAQCPNDDLFLNALKWLTTDINSVLSVQSDEPNATVPESFNLSQNYPNPFNPTTTIRFQLPKHNNVSIKIYDILGREVRMLVDKDFEPGLHTITWEGSNNSGIQVTSGIYFYRMEADQFVKVRKALFLK